MKRISILCIVVILSSHAYNQVLDEYCGIYLVKNDVVTWYEYNYIDPSKWNHIISTNYSQIEISKATNDSLKIWDIGGFLVPAKLKLDSLFFNFKDASTFSNIIGNGQFLQDSIRLNYYVGGAGGQFHISSIGRKVKTGINRLLKPELFKCYPSIVKEDFTLVGEIPLSAANVQIELATMDGRVLSSESLNERGAIKKLFIMPPVRSGLYLLMLRCDGRVNNCLKIVKR